MTSRLTALLVDVPPHPLALGRCLLERPGFACLFAGAGGTSYLACDPVAESDALDPEPSLRLAPSDRDLARAPRWIGLLPYEARRALERRGPEPDPRPAPHVVAPRWLRYGAVVEVGERVRVVGDDPEAVRELALRLRRPAPPPRDPPTLRLAEGQELRERHVARVRRALEHIARGDVYVVNVARRFRFDVSGHPLDVLKRLAERAPAPFSAAVRWGELDVVSTSPELFLCTAPDGSATTCPIKGTRPRGADAARDRALRLELDADPKERAELAMVVDVERNDLGRVAEVGSVRLVGPPEVVTHRTVHHRVARVVGQLRRGLSRGELLEAMLPSGSVTGAPKIRAMELVSELEADRRGLYTGAFGALRHDGSLELGMAIRTLTVKGGQGHYFAGGGIVADSDPEAETEETRWKALQVLGG